MITQCFAYFFSAKKRGVAYDSIESLPFTCEDLGEF